MRVHCSEADLAEDVGVEPLLSVRVLEERDESGIDLPAVVAAKENPVTPLM